MGLLKKSETSVIVNVSSDMGSLIMHGDAPSRFHVFKPAAYAPSKSALNAYTVMLAYELKDTPFKVNCVNPGFTATDFNNKLGEKTVEQGAAVIVKYATPDKDGTTEKFFIEEGETPW